MTDLDLDLQTRGCEVTEVLGPPEGGHDRTEPVDIQVEMQRSYIDYAMSVIVGRALPDVRDGLKPGHTRILYAMYDGGFRPDRGVFKCSRVVGEVLDGYHPPARCQRDLRRAVAEGPALADADAADRRAGQLRLARHRPARRDAVH